MLFVGNGFVAFLAPVVGEEEHELFVPAWTITVLTLLVVVTGVVIAYAWFGRRPVPDEAPVAVSPFTVAARKDLYGDAINEGGVMVPGQYLTRSLVYIDNRGVDGAVNGLAAMFGVLGAGAAAADRLRPLLRAVDVRRRRHRRDRSAAGEADVNPSRG